MIAFLDGVLFIQNGVHRTGDGFAVGDVHAAFLVDVQPQEVVAAFPDVFHVPQLAAVIFHHGLCEGSNDFSDLHTHFPF